MKKLRQKIIKLDQSEDDIPSQQPNSNVINYNTQCFSNFKINFHYSDVTNFKKYYPTKNLQASELKLKQFIQYTYKKVLFIFGPSGCGKTIMVTNFLQNNKIPYYFKNQMQTEDEETYETKIVSLKQVIYDSLHSSRGQVDIFKDFPGTYEGNNMNMNAFILKFKQLVRSTSAKLIFILNSEIYAPYYILSNFQKKLKSSLYKKPIQQSICDIQIKEYTVTDIGKILDTFISQHQKYRLRNHKEKLKQIKQFSYGDARKAINQLYYARLQECSKHQMPKQSKSYAKSFNKYNDDEDSFLSQKLLSNNISSMNKTKQQQKTTIFHLIGKFLYAKRLDVNKNQSRYFTQEEINLYDPPLYFNPFKLMKNCRITFKLFHDLIFQNYLDRFGKITDVKKIAKLFALVDSHFQYKFKIKTFQQESVNNDEQFIWQLIAIGSIIYNKNSSLSLSKSMFQLRKFQWNAIEKQKKHRVHLIKLYFEQSNFKNYSIYANILNQSNKLISSQVLKVFPKKRIKTNLSSLEHNIQIMRQKQQNDTPIEYDHNQNYFKDKEKQRKERTNLAMKFIEEDQDNSDISLQQ